MVKTSEELVILAASIALQIASDATDEEIALLAALYTTIGDQLALIAVNRGG